MPNLPTSINGVKIISHDSKRVTQAHSISPRLLSTLKDLFKIDIASGSTLTKVTLKAPSQSSLKASRSIEITAINGLLLSSHYPANPHIKVIVDTLQKNFESMLGRYENFGPHIKSKMGNSHFTPGYTNHLVFSVL